MHGQHGHTIIAEANDESAEICIKAPEPIPLSEAAEHYAHDRICGCCQHKLECEQLASQLFAK